MKTKLHHHHHKQRVRKSLTAYELRTFRSGSSRSRCVSPRTFASTATVTTCTSSDSHPSSSSSSSSTSYVCMPTYAAATSTSSKYAGGGSEGSGSEGSASDSGSGSEGSAMGADDASSACGGGGGCGSDVVLGSTGSNARFGESLWVPVTPQMLMLALKHLSPTGRPQTEEAVADYIMERYPCRTKRFVQQEVAKKLRCACAIGMLHRFGTKKYRMPQHKVCTSHLSTQEIASFWRLCQYDKRENMLVVCRRSPHLPEVVTKLRGHKRWANSDSTIYLDTDDQKPSKRRKHRHTRHSRR